MLQWNKYPLSCSTALSWTLLNLNTTWGKKKISCEHENITNFVPKPNKMRGHKVVSWLKGKMKEITKKAED